MVRGAAWCCVAACCVVLRVYFVLLCSVWGCEVILMRKEEEREGKREGKYLHSKIMK